MESIILENESVRALILPGRGGKTASLIYRPAQFELLAQPPKGIYPDLCADMPFNLGDASGFDDVFPSMGGDSYEGVSMPDHGEIWTGAMDAEPFADGVRLSMLCRKLPFEYKKTVRLTENGLAYNYEICSLGTEPLPVVWVCHCLMRYEEGVRFEYPRPEAPIEMLGRTPEGFDITRPPADHSALKYYFRDPVRQGECAALYTASGVKAVMRFDAEKLPYLGFWITTGLYRGDYNFAFEPATAYYDTIACAKERGRLPMLPPGETYSFSLSISLMSM